MVQLLRHVFRSWYNDIHKWFNYCSVSSGVDTMTSTNGSITAPWRQELIQWIHKWFNYWANSSGVDTVTSTNGSITAPCRQKLIQWHPQMVQSLCRVVRGWYNGIHKWFSHSAVSSEVDTMMSAIGSWAVSEPCRRPSETDTITSTGVTAINLLAAHVLREITDWEGGKNRRDKTKTRAPGYVFCPSVNSIHPNPDSLLGCFAHVTTLHPPAQLDAV